MQVSQITPSKLAEYLRTESDATFDAEITPILTVAKKFISSYTGIPETSADVTVKVLDDYEDFYIVVLVLCQDMYDNRTLYVDSRNLNKVVETILGMHCVNLL